MYVVDLKMKAIVARVTTFQGRNWPGVMPPPPQIFQDIEKGTEAEKDNPAPLYFRTYFQPCFSWPFHRNLA